MEILNSSELKVIINNPIFVTVAGALIISLITVFGHWILIRFRIRRIIRYMDETPKIKFRSKYFDSQSIASDNNLTVKEVDKLCSKSKKIKKINGLQESWVLRKHYVEGEDIPPQHRLG